MYTLFEIEFPALVDWANEELENGSRIKASKISKAAEKMRRLWLYREHIERMNKFGVGGG